MTKYQLAFIKMIHVTMLFHVFILQQFFLYILVV